MALDTPNLSHEKAPPGPPVFRTVRLILAWLVTLLILLYAWGRTLVLWMLTGRPEPWCTVMLAVGVAVVLALTWSRSAVTPRPRLHRFLATGVLTTWIAANGVLIWLFTGALIPKPFLVLLFIPSTLWLVWLAWILFWPFSWQTRLGVLLLSVAAAPAFPLFLKTEGLTGNATVNLAWRRGAVKNDGANLPAEDASSSEPVLLPAVGAGDYAQFLGPFRLGILPEARLDRDWEKTPPRLVWRQPVGPGWGAFAVVGNYAVTQEQRGPMECVVCYRISDGAPAWLHADRVRFDSSMGGPGPRATPTIADGRVYSVGATGLLNCLDGATGRALWSVNILEDNHGQNIEHGVCGSPLVMDDLVIVSPTGPNGVSLAAYHRQTGKRVWTGGTDQASYSSPLLAELAGVRQVLLYNSAAVTGHDPATGQALWSFPWANIQHVNCSQPIPNAGGPGRIFVSTGYGKGSALFQVERSSAGPWSVHPLWESRHLKTKFTTAVLHQGHVYGLDDGILTCVDLETGKQLWKAGRYEHGQVILAGDLLLVQAENGEVVLVDPVPEGLRELGRFPALAGKTWNNPALAGRFLLVRNDQEAACFELALQNE